MVFFFSLFLSLSVFSNAYAQEPIIFIVNRQNPVTSMSTRDLVDFYKKEKRKWPNGETVRFIDRNPGSPERQSFISKILKLSPSDVDVYWFAQKLHSGDSMPIQVYSDSMVIQMVGSLEGAVGYISASTPLKDGHVKQIKMSDMPSD